MTSRSLLRSAPLLAPLLALGGLAHAQASPPSTPAAAPEFKTEAGSVAVVGELAHKFFSPILVSPDGKSLLYLFRPREKKGLVTGRAPYATYVRCDADGQNPVELGNTGVTTDDMWVGLLDSAQFSADSKRLLVGLTEEGGNYLKGAPLRAFVLDPDGNRTAVPCSRRSTLGFGFVSEGRILTLDAGTPGDLSTRGYSLQLWDGKTQTTLLSAEDERAQVLRISPDRKRAAFLKVSGRGPLGLTVVVYDLETKKTSESPPFTSDDVTFDGPPQIAWDGASAGVLLHRVRSKRDFDLCRFDPKAGKIEALAHNLGVMAVLDEDRIAVLNGREGSGVYSLSKRTLITFAEIKYVVGGRGERLITLGKGKPGVALIRK